MTVALCVCRSLSLCWAFCSFFWGGDVALVHTYLHIRILGAELRYVRMWYIIPHTKTKRSRTGVHACTRHTARVHTRRLFFWDVSIRNSLRSNKIARCNSCVPIILLSIWYNVCACHSPVYHYIAATLVYLVQRIIAACVVVI